MRRPRLRPDDRDGDPRRGRGRGRRSRRLPGRWPWRRSHDSRRPQRNHRAVCGRCSRPWLSCSGSPAVSGSPRSPTPCAARRTRRPAPYDDGTAAVVSAKTAFGGRGFPGPPSISEGTLDQVRAVPGVEKASRQHLGRGTDRRQGRRRRRHRPRTSASGSTCRPASSPLQAEGGALRHRPGQVVIDAGTADREGYSVGDTISVQARGPSGSWRSPASPTFGDVDSIGHGDVRAVRPPRRAVAVRQAGPLHRDPRGRAGLGPREPRSRCPARCRSDRGGRRPLQPRRASRS